MRYSILSGLQAKTKNQEMASSDKKIAEGQEHLRLAEKCLKTGFLKWKPDYDTAVDEYSKAAICFKNAKAHELCVDTYLKASNAQQKQGSAFHAAKSLEAAALICKDLKKFEQIADLYMEASQLYLEHGVPDTAGIALEKGAKMIEPIIPARAIDLYRRAADVGEAEDRPRQSAEAIGRVARICMKLKRLDDAASALTQEIEYLLTVENSHGAINKLVMGMVLVRLHQDDSVAAQKAFQAALQYKGYVESQEAGPTQSLIEAYDDGDQDAVTQIACSPIFRYMENEFTKLARDLTVPGGRKKPSQKPSAATGATTSSDSRDVDTHAQSEESDDEIDLK